MNLGNWIRRARLARTNAGTEGAALVGTSMKTHLGNATTVEAALEYLDANQAGAGGLNDPLMLLRQGDCETNGIQSVAAGTGIAVTTVSEAATVEANNPLTVAADAATVTFDLSLSKHQIVTLGGNRTLALSNVDAKRPAFTLTLVQDGVGGRTVTWFSGISWVAGGTPPTLTTTAGKMDHFGFLRTGSGAYQGFVLGQNG